MLVSYQETLQSAMETWATFSIIDHRKPIYRQALALFDRIVVPLPSKPIGDQTQEELDQLEAEVAYLEKEQAARRYDWRSSEFEQWRKPVLADALALGINRDPYLDTRLMLSDKFESPEVQAVPVYGGMQQFQDARNALNLAEEALTIEIAQKLPVPEYDTPLANLIELRNKPAFRRALEDLLEWKRDKAPAIVLSNDRKNAIAAAMRDFDKLTKTYSEAMESAGHKKGESVISFLFTAITHPEPLGLIKESLVTFRALREPSWRKLSAMKCAPGGVVYQFQEGV
jgi:hypothetical protein